MRNYYQETDPNIIFSFPSKLSYTFPIEPTDETIGSTLNPYFFSSPEESNLIKTAWRTVSYNSNPEVSGRARIILSNIRESIVSFQHLGFDLVYLPSLRAFNVDDGSVLIEWIFKNFRIGFSIEPNADESGWYLVSSKDLGEISASGYISTIDFKILFQWLLNFVLANS